MEKIGIFFALSGDIYQPSYRSDLIRICDVCFVYINDNIKNLINNGYLVECHVLLNYQNELIPNLVESIKEIFLKYSIPLKKSLICFLPNHDFIACNFYKIIYIRNIYLRLNKK